MKTLDFKLNIQTKDAEKGVDRFNKELEETQKLTELQLALDAADAASSVSELNAAMEQLQSQALKFGQGSDEFIKAATKAGQLKKRMDDVNRSIDTVAQGGQLGQLTTSFEGLKQSAMSFDIEGIKNNFALMKTQILGSATAALGLGQGLSVAAIAARGLAVALAATGITVVIAAVAVLVSEFEDLADAGGLLGTIFTAIGDSVEVVRQGILQLLDSLGLIDLAAKQAADAQKDAFDELKSQLEINGDLYDEYTKRKLELEVEFYEKIEEVRKNDELSEEQKQARIIGLNARKAREIERIDKEQAAKKEQQRKDEIKAEKEKAAAIIQANADYFDQLASYEDAAFANLTKDIELSLATTEAALKEQVKNNELSVKDFEYNMLELQRIQLESFVSLGELEVQSLEKQAADKKQSIEDTYDFERDKLIESLVNNEITRKEYNVRLEILRQKRATDEIEIENDILEKKTEIEKAKTKIVETQLAKENMSREANRELVEQYQNEDLEKYETEYLIEKLALYQMYNDGVIKNEEALQQQLDAIELRQAKERVAIFANTISQMIQNKDFFINEQKMTEEEFTLWLKLKQDEQLQAMQDLAEKEKEINDGVTQHKLNNIDKFNAAFLAAQDKINALTQAASIYSNQISSIMSMVHEQRLLQIEETMNQELLALNARFNQGLINEVDYTNARLAIERDYNKKKYKEDKKAFNQQKAINIVNAIITGIQSVQAAFASGMAYPFIGPATGAIFAGIAAAFSAAQVGLIAAEKFPSEATYNGGVPSVSLPSTTTPSTGGAGGAGGVSPQIPPSFFTNSGAVQGTDAMLNPGGIYQAPGSGNQQVWVLESDITGTQNQVSVTEDRSYFDAGAYGG